MDDINKLYKLKGMEVEANYLSDRLVDIKRKTMGTLNDAFYFAKVYIDPEKPILVRNPYISSPENVIKKVLEKSNSSDEYKYSI